MIKQRMVAKYDLSSLTTMVSAAAPLGKTLSEELVEKLNLPNMQLRQGSLHFVEH